MARQVVGAAIIAHGRVLAARRAAQSAAARRWEFPGGKSMPGEDAGAAAVREVREELGCAIRVTRVLDGRQPIDPTHELSVVLAQLVGGEPTPSEHGAIRWLQPEELYDVDWLPSDRPFLAQLHRLLSLGEPLVGGNVGGAVRIGPTVRRPTGPWTPAVHALLTHLRAAGMPATPHVLGVDDQDREVLTYLPGRVVDVDSEMASDGALVDAMRWLRRYHDTVAGFVHPGPWRTVTRPLRDGELICHHDFAPYNVALSSAADGDRVVGVFDWDMAGPGTRVEDLAFAAWNWVPLYRRLPATEVVRRLCVLVDGYDADVTPVEALVAVVPRIERSLALIAAGQQAGDPGMLSLAAVGEPARTAAALEDLRGRIPDIRTELATAAGR